MYRWGPLTHAPSLLSGDGGFPRSIDDLWEHADPEEVDRELRTQVERAIAWGIDVSHLAPHLTAITLRPEFFGIYLDLAVEFALPIRLPSTITRRAGRISVPPARRRGRRGVPRPLRSRLAGRQPERVAAALDSPRARRHRDPHPAGDRHTGGAGAGGRRRAVDRRPRPRRSTRSCRCRSTRRAATLIGYRDLARCDAAPVRRVPGHAVQALPDRPG